MKKRRTCVCCGYSSHTYQEFRHPRIGEGPYRWDDECRLDFICRSAIKCEERGRRLGL